MFSVLVVLTALLLTIALHELGHLVAARFFGISVSAFSIGFGPKLFGFRTSRGGQKGEIDWQVRLLPLGGFVQAHGMFADDPKSERKTLLSEGRTEEECSKLLASDRLYCNRPGWQQAIFASAGVVVNLVLSFLAATFMGWVLAPSPLPQHVRVESVGAALSSSLDLRTRDVIQSINGEEVHSLPQVMAALKETRGAVLEMVVLRKRMTESVLLKIPQPAEGVFAESDVAFKEIPARQPSSLFGAAAEAGRLILETSGRMFKSLRHPEANASSPIGVVRQVETLQQEFPGARLWVMVFASFNLLLGLFNILPMLPLDGGHLVCALFKAVVGVQVPRTVQVAIAIVGGMALYWLSSVGIARDVENLLR